MNYEEHIGENIKDVRLSLGLSQQAVADICGFSNTILSQYENGKKTPNLVTTAKIAKALRVSIDRIYYGDENNAFIAAESDGGRKIVNSVYLLWSKGVIRYYEDYVYNNIPIPDERYNEKLGVYLHLVEHQEPIRRLINSLNEFEQRKDTYQNPDSFLEMLFDSVTTEINQEIKAKKIEKTDKSQEGRYFKRHSKG